MLRVRVDGKLSGPFATTKGLRQGDGLACKRSVIVWLNFEV